MNTLQRSTNISENNSMYLMNLLKPLVTVRFVLYENFKTVNFFSFSNLYKAICYMKPLFTNGRTTLSSKIRNTKKNYKCACEDFDDGNCVSNIILTNSEDLLNFCRKKKFELKYNESFEARRLIKKHNTILLNSFAVLKIFGLENFQYLNYNLNISEVQITNYYSTIKSTTNSTPTKEKSGREIKIKITDFPIKLTLVNDSSSSIASNSPTAKAVSSITLYNYGLQEL